MGLEQKLEKLVNECKDLEQVFINDFDYDTLSLYKTKEAVIEIYGTENTSSLCKIYETYYSILKAGLDELKKL